jgi:small-conductance mechanosensitive channel
VSYLIAGVAVISVLASNSAMAVGVGSATGVMIALTVQGLASNVIAGMFLATSRHVQKGSELTIMGKTGHLVEIRLIYTIIDTGEKLMFIPNSIMMSNAIEYKKELPRQ